MIQNLKFFQTVVIQNVISPGPELQKMRKKSKETSSRRRVWYALKKKAQTAVKDHTEVMLKSVTPLVVAWTILWVSTNVYNIVQDRFIIDINSSLQLYTSVDAIL
jgi:hypothetical protein